MPHKATHLNLCTTSSLLFLLNSLQSIYLLQQHMVQLYTLIICLYLLYVMAQLYTLIICLYLLYVQQDLPYYKFSLPVLFFQALSRQSLPILLHVCIVLFFSPKHYLGNHCPYCCMSVLSTIFSHPSCIRRNISQIRILKWRSK